MTRTIIQGLFLVFYIIPTVLFAQYRVQEQNSELSIFGTSTLHDWEIEATGLDGKAGISIDDIVNVQSLEFEVVVSELESGKGAMDDNTYEALEEEKYPKVRYQLSSVDNVDQVSPNQYRLTTTGMLTIAGESRSIKMPVMASTGESAVSFEGSYKMKMTDFEIDPPTAVFGTIKTGDEVEIKFNVNYIK